MPRSIMKYLTEAFENEFVEYRKEKKIYSGILFEKLVFMLLEELFPSFSWHDTPITHDGSKDFYAQYDETLYWAECKNYSDKISLQTIAPTLVMAQLCNADEIYFFSQSEIKDNVKKKLCYYANINQKKIRFYDDIALEQIIFEQKRVYNHFFKSYHFSNVDFCKETTPVILYDYLKNPFLNKKKDESFFSPTNLPVFKINEIITIHIYGINNSSKNNAAITVQINPDCKDLLCFELLDEHMKRSEIINYFYSAEITPNETCFHSINLKIISHKAQLELPQLIVNIEQGGYTKEKKLGGLNFHCDLLHRSVFLDSFYQNILYVLEQKILNQNVLSGILLIGSSGTGKTRTLEETLSLLVKYNYRVLNFIGVEHDSGKNILKEIIYILFEVSEELIMQSFTIKDASDSLSDIFEMLYKMNQNKISSVDITDQYGELIFERMIQGKYALIIDNIQYFDYPLLHFLEKLIIYGKNCGRGNSLFLAFSINTDYASENTDITKIKFLFQQLQNTNVCRMATWFLDGFHSPGSALEFIKQLLGINNANYDALFQKILDKTSLLPFYIECIVEVLRNFKSVTFSESRCIIQNPVLFEDELTNLPDSVEGNIERRWQFFIQHHPNEDNYINLLSIVHIFGECDKDLLMSLRLNTALLKDLCKYHILKREETVNTDKYTFIHDLMEKFFCEYISDFDNIAYEYLTKTGYKHLKNFYPVVYNLCILYSKNYTPEELAAIIQAGIHIEIPYKIFYSYYKNCMKALLESYETFICKSEWYDLGYFIAKQLKLRIGNKAAYDVISKLFCTLENGNFEDRYYYNSFGELLFFYGEINQQLTYYQDVIFLYLKYLDRYKILEKSNSTEEIRSNIAFIYNRLSVAYKHFPDSVRHQKHLHYINLSLYMSRTLKNRQFLAENCYDKGSYYYCHIKYKKRVLDYWESCCNLVKKYHIKVMTLHYIEHRIQMALIRQQTDEIPQLLDKGFDYIEHGKYNEQAIYFKRFFYYAKAIYYLLKRTDYEIVHNSLQHAEEALLMLGKNNMTYINYLRGKLYACLNDSEHTYEFYKEAYLQAFDLTILHKDTFIDLLTEDMLIKFRELNIDQKNFPINYLKKENHCLMAKRLFSMDKKQFLIFRNNYRAKSIIQSLDGKENYPNI